MKILATFALLAVLGCSSKPQPGIVIQRVHTIDGCSAGFSVIYNWTTEKWSCEGSISHVTREQWEAAQGLYNPQPSPDSPCRYTAPNHAVVACPDSHGGVTFSDTRTGFTWYRECPMCPGLVLDGPMDDTLPPSGDVK